MKATDLEPPLKTLQQGLSSGDNAQAAAAEEAPVQDSMDLDNTTNGEEDLSIQSQRLREIKTKAVLVLSELTKQEQSPGDNSEKIALSQGLDDIMSKAEKLLSDLSQSETASPQVKSASTVESSERKTEFFFQDEACSEEIEKFIEQIEKLKNSPESAESNSTFGPPEDMQTDVEGLDLRDNEDESILEINGNGDATSYKVFRLTRNYRVLSLLKLLLLLFSSPPFPGHRLTSILLVVLFFATGA